MLTFHILRYFILKLKKDIFNDNKKIEIKKKLMFYSLPETKTVTTY